jgi:hypothetical protein
MADPGEGEPRRTDLEAAAEALLSLPACGVDRSTTALAGGVDNPPPVPAAQAEPPLW